METSPSIFEGMQFTTQLVHLRAWPQMQLGFALQVKHVCPNKPHTVIAGYTVGE